MNYQIKITGMTCEACSKIILKSLEGHLELVSLKGDVLTYEADTSKEDLILKLIDPLGYGIKRKKLHWTGFAFVALLITFIILSRLIYDHLGFNRLSQDTALIGVFIFGLMTSLHCVGMCGGIALTQFDHDKKKNIFNSIKYNLGRILTYGALGGLLGGLGQGIELSQTRRSFTFVIIALIMLLMGIKTLD